MRYHGEAGLHEAPYFTLGQAVDKAVNPLVGEIAEIALLGRSLPDGDAVTAFARKCSRLYFS